jgi:hypothetical protein
VENQNPHLCRKKRGKDAPGRCIPGLRKKTFQITSAMYNAKDEYFVVVKAIEDQMFEKSRDRCSSYVPEYPSPKCASRTRARTPEYAQNGGTDRLLPSPT